MSDGKLQRLPYYACLYSRLLKKMIGARIAAKFLNGVSPYLNFVVFYLTWRCNLRCRMCQFYGESGSKKNFSQSAMRRQEMSSEEWKKVVDDLVPFTPTIHLFGGEPLLYENSIELINYIKKTGLRCQMVTNGTLLKEKSKSIVESGLDEIWISIDGPEEIHNEIRRVRSFRKILDGISCITDDKNNMNIRTPAIRIICTISDMNYLYLDDLVRSLEGLDIYSILFSHLRFVNKDLITRHNSVLKREFQTESQSWSGYVLDLSEMDISQLMQQMEKLKENNNRFRIDFDPDLSPSEIREYYNNIQISFKKKCIVPWLTAIITPEGNVSPCQDYSVGSVRTTNFQDVWNGAKCVNFRRTLKRMKKLPACDRCPSIHRYGFKSFSNELFYGLKDFLRT